MIEFHWSLLSTLLVLWLASVLYLMCPKVNFSCSIGRTQCFYFLCDVLMLFALFFQFSTIFLLLMLWIGLFFKIHAALKSPAVTSVLLEKPSFTIICLIPAIIGFHHLTDKPVLLPHRLCFGRLPWHCLWKMEGWWLCVCVCVCGGWGGFLRVYPDGINDLPLPLGEAPNVTHAEEWSPRETSPWIGCCHNNNLGE